MILDPVFWCIVALEDCQNLQNAGDACCQIRTECDVGYCHVINCGEALEPHSWRIFGSAWVHSTLAHHFPGITPSTLVSISGCVPSCLTSLVAPLLAVILSNATSYPVRRQYRSLEGKHCGGSRRTTH